MSEAEIYRRWLVGKLSTPLVENADIRAVDKTDNVSQVEPDGLKKAA